MDVLELIRKGVFEIYEHYNKQEVTIYLTNWQYHEVRKYYYAHVAVEIGYRTGDTEMRIFGNEVKIETREDNLDAIRLEFQLYNGQPPVVHYVR